MKKQIIIVGGGDTFATHEDYLNFLRDFNADLERYKYGKDDWKPWLHRKLSDEFDVYRIVMPNVFNANYAEWKLWFEKFFPHFRNGVILIGHSLGASFLAKYLSENKFPREIKAVMLVAGVFDKDSDGNSLLSFALPEKLNMQSENTMIYHSIDDPVVPFSALGHFKEAIPEAHTRIFKDRKHFNMEEFPELLEDIKSLKF